MDWQTFLNILLAVLAGILGFKNWQMNQRHEDRQETTEMAEIQIKLSQAMDMLRDLQKDMRSVSIISERVVVIETRLTEVFTRLEKLEARNEH